MDLPVGDVPDVDLNRRLGGRCIGTFGEARTHARDPEVEFAYLEFHLDDITYNPSHPSSEHAGVNAGD